MRKKDTYEQMIDYLDHGQEKIKYPSRYFRQLRDSPWLSQMDGDDQNDIEAQQLNEAKVIQRETIIREVAQASGISAQEARTINHNVTNNYHNHPPNPPSAKVSVGITQTEHPLKQDTGTGTDYQEPPDRHTPQPPPSGQAMHVSTTRQGSYGSNSQTSASFTHQGFRGSTSSHEGGVTSFGTPPGPDAPSKVNPIIDRKGGRQPSSEKVPVRVDMSVDDKAMDWQQQMNADKEFQAQEARSKTRAMASSVRAHLDDVEGSRLKNRLSVKEASKARDSVLNQYLAQAHANAQARTEGKRHDDEEIPQVKGKQVEQLRKQFEKAKRDKDEKEVIKPPPARSKTRSKSKQPQEKEEIPQVMRMKAIRDRPESEPTPQLRVPPKKLAIKDRSSSPLIPQASKARSRSRGRSVLSRADKEEIKGPTREEFKRAALPTKHVTNALAHHDLNQLEKASNIIREMHAEHADKRQKVGNGRAKTTKTRNKQPRAIPVA